VLSLLIIYIYIFFFGDNTEIVLFNIVIELYDGKLGVI
jgi:hypothetical protein